jgi:hypothetical protein
MEFTNRITKQTTKETIMRNMYELARQLQAPGVHTVATFNPTRLTKTIRNMARKSIASGYHSGGWSSKTRDVRELVFSLAGEKPIVYVAQGADYMSFTTPRPITDDNLSEMIGLLEADCTLQKIGYDDSGERRYRPTREVFNATIDERCVENITKIKVADQGKARHMVVRTNKLRQQIAEVFLRERTVEEIAIAERLARLLDGDEDFPIPTTHNF